MCTIVYVILCLAIFIKHQLVADRQTDILITTQDHNIYCAGTGSYGKMFTVCLNLNLKPLSRVQNTLADYLFYISIQWYFTYSQLLHMFS